MSNDNSIEIKIILLGECGVGKTSIISKYIHDKIDNEHKSSISVNKEEKILIIDNKKIILNIWDTIAQEKYRSISKIFYQGTQILILIYDVTDIKSFDELDFWKNSFFENYGKDDVIIGVAGNKEDLFLEKIIDEEKGKKYSKKINATFAQLSAKTNKKGIEDFILELVNQYLTKKLNSWEILELELRRKQSVKLDKKTTNNKNSKKGGCCGGGKSKNENISEEDKYNVIESIFLGADRVGKTSLIKRIVGKDFNKQEKHTNELKEYETVYIAEEMNKILKIYDINNEKREDKKIQNVIRKCQIFFLVYDLNNIMSFKEIENWIKVINRYKEDDKVKTNYVFVIIGNKKDLLESNKNIKKPDIDGGKKLAILNSAVFCSTTAKEDNDIKNIIDIACQKLFNPD